MELTYYLLSALLVIASSMPFVSDQHWVFRIFDFGRIQLMFLQLIMLAAGFFMIGDRNAAFWAMEAALAGFFIYHSIILFPYTHLYPVGNRTNKAKDSESISILSVNVYQYNKEYQLLIDLVNEIKPDIVLTMETNKDWENALSVLEKDYPNATKVPLDNTYGMHFYTHLKVQRSKVNYFMADDLPSVEIDLETRNHNKFTFFGVHPPPPSPTEETTSKERDGELLMVAKMVKKLKHPALVVGDFNNVAWARSSVLFRKTSELIDPRIGRGFISTYHAKYKWLRFPIDLFFHSTDVFIEEFKTLRHIGSDHLPQYCKFFINHQSTVQENQVETADHGEKQEANEMIAEGKKM